MGLVAGGPVVGGDEEHAAGRRAVDVQVGAVAGLVEVAALLVQEEGAAARALGVGPVDVGHLREIDRAVREGRALGGLVDVEVGVDAVGVAGEHRAQRHGRHLAVAGHLGGAGPALVGGHGHHDVLARARGELAREVAVLRAQEVAIAVDGDGDGVDGGIRDRPLHRDHSPHRPAPRGRGEPDLRSLRALARGHARVPGRGGGLRGQDERGDGGEHLEPLLAGAGAPDPGIIPEPGGSPPRQVPGQPRNARAGRKTEVFRAAARSVCAEGRGAEPCPAGDGGSTRMAERPDASSGHSPCRDPRKVHGRFQWRRQPDRETFATFPRPRSGILPT